MFSEDMEKGERCDNCRSSIRHDHLENVGATQLEMKNNFCAIVPETQIWNALEFIYKVSWKSFQNYQLAKKVCLLNSQEDIKLCSNCTSLLSEYYNAHQNFENACNPSSPIQLLKEFRINKNNCPVSLPEESNSNWPSENQYGSELMGEDNTESDVKEDLFDTFTFEDAEEDHVISSQESIETKYETLPIMSIDNSMSHKSVPNSLTRKATLRRLRSRELVIKAEKLSPEEIHQFTNNKTVNKSSSRKQTSPKIKNRKVVMKTGKNIRKPSVTKLQGVLDAFGQVDGNIIKTEPDTSNSMLSDVSQRVKHERSQKNRVSKCKTGKKMSETEFQERVSYALSNTKDKTKCRKIVISGRFICNVCGKSFATYPTLKYHHWPTHDETMKKFICDICGKIVMRKYDLKRHKISAHATEEEKNKYRTKCNICEKIVYKHCLQSHMFHSHPENPRDKYKCETCGAEYKNKQTYQCHILKHTEGPQQCDVCSKFLPSSKSLENHKKQVHGEKKLPCQKCSKKFITKSELKLHEVVHEEVRKHVCDECGKTFKHTQHFRNHLRGHQDIQEKGEGAFTCDVCNDGKPFKHSLSLYKHKQRMHPSKRIAEKIHKCSFCEKRLCSQYNLRIHEKMHQELPGFKPRVRQKLPGHMLFISSNGESQI